MKRLATWMSLGGLAVGLALGCNEKKEPPVAEAPAQEKAPSFPDNQVPPPEPQPVTAAPAKEYKPPVDTAVTNPVATPEAKPKPQPKEQYAQSKKQAERIHVVQKGETLQKISMKYYKTTKKWQRIFRANREVLKDNPDMLPPGTKLVIP